MSRIFITYLWRDPYFFLSAVFMVIFSICCHEFMHAWVALKEGDPTAADRGHLTLNPLKQMGLYSLLLLAIFGLAWGQVPVDPSNFRSRRSDLKVSLAGPLTNLALAIVFLILCAVLFYGGVEHNRAIGMIFYGCVLNQVLFVLNMLLVPGFDGFGVVRHFFPGFLQLKSEVGTIVTVVLIVVLFSCIKYLFFLAEFLALNALALMERVFM